jgi:hypothetical protein
VRGRCPSPSLTMWFVLAGISPCNTSVLGTALSAASARAQGKQVPLGEAPRKGSGGEDTQPPAAPVSATAAAADAGRESAAAG